MTEREKDNNYKIFMNENKNLIHFNAPIEEEFTLELIEKLNELEELELDKSREIINKLKRNSYISIKEEDYINPILLEIHSNGGFIHDAFSVVDTIRTLKVPVHTICKGFVASSATLISLAGKKRFMTKNTFFLIHEIKDEFFGDLSFIKDCVYNTSTIMEHIIDYYEENSSLPKEDIRKHIQNEKYWTSKQCLEYGFIDEII